MTEFRLARAALAAAARTRAAKTRALVITDGGAVVMAVAAAGGAWMASPLPRWPGVLCFLAGWWWRRLMLCLVAVALASSALGARAEAGLAPPDVARFSGVATLVGDPNYVTGALRVDVRVGGRRLEAWARGLPARRLADRLSGERVALEGLIGPIPAKVRPWLVSRHIAGRLSITEVGSWAPGSAVSRWANGLRRSMLGGASSLPVDQRALFAGFVLGDDRGQPVEVVEDFRASGLSHLLVVSGQNVLFVLALAAPLLRRLGLGSRFVAGVALIIFFGVLTRWEPSVLRAVSMAAVSMLAATLGRPTSRLRVLALTVTFLVLVDPLLVRSLGFALSVGACVGIAILATPLATRIPGPRWLAEALAVTVAAQIGVAPILVPAFGGLPVASIPANLLAVPAAGFLMMWGMSAGMVAGWVGGPLATALHLPTRLLVWGISWVAQGAAAWPLGYVRSGQILMACGLLGVAVAIGRWRPTWVTAQAQVGVRIGIAGLVLVVLLGWPVASQRWPPDLDGIELTEGVKLWRTQGATVLVVDGARGSPGRLLSGLRLASVRRLDVVVLARRGAADARAVAPMLRRIPYRLILAAPGSRVAGAVVPEPDSRVDVGPLSLKLDLANEIPQVGVGRP